MATIELSDGRKVPIVKPHLGDQMEVERQMKRTNPKYGAAQFKEDLKLSGFQTAFTVFASFNRAGVPTTIGDVLELDLQELSTIITREPGEFADDEADETDSGDEQSPDPQLAPTGDADAAQPTPSHLSSTD